MARHTIVKVCGLTRLGDARLAYAAGADWLGVIVFGESPRSVSIETAREISIALDGAITVGVMVAPAPNQALAIAHAAGVSRIQVHRVDPSTWPREFPIPVTFVVGVDADGSLAAPLPAAEHLVMLDTADPNQAGGTGRTFPWNTARIVSAARDVMIAGGLGPDNVAEAIAAVRPFGVDASSRLESAPGIKDEALVRRYVAAVRASDAVTEDE